MAERYLTAAEVSDRLEGAISVKTLTNWRSNPKANGPPFRRFGNRILYPESGFEQWERGQEFRSTREYPAKTDPPAASAPPPAEGLETVDEIDALWTKMLSADSETTPRRGRLRK